MTLDNDLNIQQLFIYRYLLDKPDPIQNLSQDIQDLRFFPERIEGSYRAEWLTYVKKRLHELKQLPDVQQSLFWKKLEHTMAAPEQDKQLSHSLALIQTSLQISSDHKISVIKIPVKTYIEQLIKL